MGVFWSCCEGNEDRCVHCNRRAVNNLTIKNNECEICIQRRSRNQVPHASRTRRQPYRPSGNQRNEIRSKPKPAPVPVLTNKPCPLFGMFQCKCGRTWESRKSWRGRYQICKVCRRHVHPHTQRELRPGDFKAGRSREDAKQDHPMDLCQMCMELGYYCRKYGN